MSVLAFTVYGLPAPQGSKRYLGHGVMVESSTRVKPWRESVRQAALDVIAVEHLDDTMPLSGPLVLSVVFGLPRPKSHYRTGRNAHLLRDAAPDRPAVRPDLDKLLRAVSDALTDVAWSDDAQVVEIWASKVYAHRPNTRIRVEHEGLSPQVKAAMEAIL